MPSTTEPHDKTCDQSAYEQTAHPQTFLFLRSEKPSTDFRLALAYELQKMGHDVTYIYLQKRPMRVDVAAPHQQFHMSLIAFMIMILRTFAWRTDVVVFNSTNLTFPVLSLLLRCVLWGRWCFDLHDDLLYGAQGFKRLKGNVILWMLTRMSRYTLCASPLLVERVPQAIHLGNASNLSRALREGLISHRILVLSSIDERFDFALMEDVAKHHQAITFVIRGHISQAKHLCQERLEALLKRNANIRYDGAYTNKDIASLLSDYHVTFAPYLTPSPHTRYIDPLRFHHCLRSGLEIITTAIPASEEWHKRIHVIENANDFGFMIAELNAGTRPLRNRDVAVESPSWFERAQQLERLLKDDQYC